MPAFPLIQVDAFTTQPLAGNACAVVFEADELSDSTMLAIAREMNLSETAFVLRSRSADFRARYFTPAEEIPMAGHPTLATAFALVDSGRLALEGAVTRFQLELQVGNIPIEIRSEGGAVDAIFMSQQKPEFLASLPAEEVLPAFGLPPEDALPGAAIQVVSTGTPQLMVPLAEPGALAAASLDFDRYARLRASASFFSAHLFCLRGFTEAGDTSARHFVSPPDLVEDPFTGSATGGMGAYLWRYGLLSSPRFVAEQGHGMHRPGSARVEVVGPPDEIESVRVGGAAVAVLRGELVV
jgi:trans-2,3-dihydro-3-hydroxyanthranilate isomerase